MVRLVFVCEVVLFVQCLVYRGTSSRNNGFLWVTQGSGRFPSKSPERGIPERITEKMYLPSETRN